MRNNINLIEVLPGLKLEIEAKELDSKKEKLRNDFNIKEARKNLVDFSLFLDEERIPHGVIYGTLLGLYRDKELIKHDYDVDVYVLGEHYKLLLKSLIKIKEIGFKIIRFKKRLISIERNKEYIDIYIFRKYFNIRKSGSNIIRSYFLDAFDSIQIKEKTINTPSNIEKFLILAYGSNWRTPIKGKNACITNKYIRLFLRALAIFRSIFKPKSYKKLLRIIIKYSKRFK